MVVENVSVISKEDAYKALYETTKRNFYVKYVYAVLLILVGVAVLCYGLWQKSAAWDSMGGVFAAFGLAYGIYNTVMLVRSPKDIRKTNKDVVEYGVTYNYHFREQGCDLLIVINGRKEKVTYKYTDFKKVYELNDRYEIRLAESTVLYVMKSAFENERMVEFFKKNLGTNKKLKIVNRMKEEKK